MVLEIRTAVTIREKVNDGDVQRGLLIRGVVKI